MTSLAPHSPHRRALRFGILALGAAWLLGGCSQPSDAPAGAAAPVARYAAVARGRIDIEGGLLALSMPREGVLATVAVHEGDSVKQGQLLAALDAVPAQLAVDAAQDMATQKLQEARYELQQRSLHAPFDAQVVHVAAQPGASVSPGSGALFTLLPDKPRIVRAELNDSFVGAVHPGMPAEVSADSDRDGSHWAAHVLRIGQVYGPATLENDPQVRANARTVECVLTFDQPSSLRIGQRVVVRFDKPAGAAKD
jgi:multidrug resistance efflux pump